MKKTIKIMALVLCLIFTASLMAACGNDNKTETNNTTDAVTTAQIETTAAALTIDETQAKEIVWADLSIQETAAENLTVELKDNSYIIAFQWSGFDYQYTVSAITGDILETIFDGEVLE